MNESVDKSTHFRQMSLIVPKLDCEQSLFFVKFSEGSAGMRECRVAKPRDARKEGASPVSCLQPLVLSFSFLARFTLRTKKKERLLVL